MNNCILHFQLDSIHLVYKDLYENGKLFSTIPDWNSAHRIHVKVLGSLLFHWQFPDKTSHVSTSCSWQNSTTVKWKISTNTINSLLSDLVNVLSNCMFLPVKMYFWWSIHTGKQSPLQPFQAIHICNSVRFNNHYMYEPEYIKDTGFVC